MNPTFSLLLPTKQRPGLVKRLLDSLLETTLDIKGLEVVFVVDEDDASLDKVNLTSIQCQVVRVKPLMPMGAMMNLAWRTSRGRWLMLMNDDVVFRTRGWDRIVAAAFAPFADGVALVYGNDLDQGERVASFPILPRAACEAMGKLVPGAYLNIHLESHLMDIFRKLGKSHPGRVVYLPDVCFEHMHCDNGKQTADATSVKRSPRSDDRFFVETEFDRALCALKLGRLIEKAPEPFDPSPLVESTVAIG